MVDFSNIFNMGGEGSEGLAGKQKVKDDLEQYISMKKAQGFNQAEDIDLIDELLEKTMEKASVYDRVEKANRAINEMIREGVDSLDTESINEINQQLQQVEADTGRRIDLDTDNLQQSLDDVQAQMNVISNQTYQEQSASVKQLQQEMSPEMANVAGRVYRNRGQEGMQESIQGMSNEDLINEIYNAEGGFQKLRGAFGEFSAMPVMRDKGAKTFQDKLQKMPEQDQEELHNRLVQDFEPIATQQYDDFIEDLRLRIQRHREILDELQTMDDDIFSTLTRELREKGFLTEGQREELTNMPRGEAVDQYGGRMASIKTGIEHGDFEEGVENTVFGGVRAGGEGITRRPEAMTPTPDQGGVGDQGGDGGGGGGDNYPPEGEEDGNIFRNNRFENNEFLLPEGSTPVSNTVPISEGGYISPNAPNQADIGQSGGLMGGAAAGYAAGQYGLGSTGAPGRTSGDVGQAKSKGIMGTLGKTGMGAVAFGGMSALTDFATPGGRTGAESAMGSVGSAGSGIGAGIGAMLSAGNPAGLLIGSYLGGQVGDVVGQMASPYLNYIQQQKAYESMTGENLQGEGSESGVWAGLQSTSLVGSAEPNIQSEQASARLRNLNLAPEKVQQLTDTLLQLGATSEEAAESIGPLSDVLAQTNIDPTVAGTIARNAMVESDGEGEGLGIEAVEHIADRIQETARGGIYSQPEIEQAVMSGMETMGPWSGYQQAATNSMALRNTLGSATDDTAMIGRQTGAAESMEQNAANLIYDVGGQAMARNYGLPENADPQGEMWTPEVNAASYRAAAEVFQMFADENGEIDAQDWPTIQQMFQSPGYAPLLGNIDPKYAYEQWQDENINAQSFISDAREQNQETQQAQQKQHKRAGGDIGDADKYGVRGAEEGRFGKLLPGDQTRLMAGGKQRGLIKESEKTAASGIGNVGQIMRTDKGIDPSKIKLENGATFEDLKDDPDMMKKVQRGKIRIEHGDQKMTAQQFSRQLIQKGGYSNKKGELKFGQERSDEKSGKSQKVQVEFTGMAKDFFKEAKADNPRGMPNYVNRANDQKAADSGQPENGG